MSKLVLLGGPTGVGKSTTLRMMERSLPKLALLDADDVWRVSDDLAMEENRNIAISNATRVLQGYVEARCETAILAWVFARSLLYEPIIAGLEDTFDAVHQLYLVATPQALRQRLAARDSLNRLDYSISRLELIRSLPYPKIDTTDLSPAEVADGVLERVRDL